MSDFLAVMAAHSEQRWRAAAAVEPEVVLKARALATPTPPALALHGGFDLIAEVKLVAPSAGRLATPPADRAGFVVGQARRYVDAGACAISVLTEPSRFEGALDDLSAVAAAVPVPAMRKDFLVAPYQIWEARVRGAGGVLLIVRMLDDDALRALCDASIEAGLFVLLEAFDADDLTRCAALVSAWPAGAPPLLVGVNTRDLSTLQVVEDRLVSLVPLLPAGVPAVAESGHRTADDARRSRQLGYTVALVGSALMTAPDAAVLGRAMLDAARSVTS